MPAAGFDTSAEMVVFLVLSWLAYGLIIATV